MDNIQVLHRRERQKEIVNKELNFKKLKNFSWMRHIILAACSIVTVFPFVWMILSSLKTQTEVMDTSVFVPEVPQWGNYSEVIFNSPILRYIGNSLFVSVSIVILQVLSGALLAYALTFLVFRGRTTLFAIIMGTYMLPAAATYVPSYIILSKMNLLDTYEGLILSSTVSIFGIFLLRQAFMQLPLSLVEAAKIDGASHWHILWKIVYPICKPSFITFLLISFIGSYNNYMWPSLITNSKELSLVSQGLRRFFIEGGAYGTKWPLVMAGSTVIVLPLLVLFAVAQKWFISGISDTGVKG